MHPACHQLDTSHICCYDADETQTLFLPRHVDGTVDKAATASARRFFKSIVVRGPGNILWICTGSSMALFWGNVGLTSTNGDSLLLHNTRLDLAVELAVDVMDYCWQYLAELALERHNIQLDPLLRQFAGNSPALLTYLVADFVQDPMDDVVAFYNLHMSKLVAEVRGIPCFQSVKIGMQGCVIQPIIACVHMTASSATSRHG